MAVRELKKERTQIEEVKKDSHFLQYLPDYSHFFYLRTPLLTPINMRPDRHAIMEKYFDLAFSEMPVYQSKKIRKLINVEPYLNFVSQNIIHAYDFWNNFFDIVELPMSSIHGDFHADNIFIKDDRLFFIDWIRYRKESSRFFDLFDYYIFFGKDAHIPWFEFWKKCISSDSRKIFNIIFTEMHLIAYALWKISEEQKTLYERNNMNKYKIKKYITVIEELTDYAKKYSF